MRARRVYPHSGLVEKQETLGASEDARRTWLPDFGRPSAARRFLQDLERHCPGQQAAVFCEDSIDGRVVSEEEAIEIQSQFDPAAEVQPPATQQAVRRRAAEPGPSSSGPIASAKRARRSAAPPSSAIAPQDDRHAAKKAKKTPPQRAARAGELTMFAAVCNALP